MNKMPVAGSVHVKTKTLHLCACNQQTLLQDLIFTNLVRLCSICNAFAMVHVGYIMSLRSLVSS